MVFQLKPTQFNNFKGKVAKALGRPRRWNDAQRFAVPSYTTTERDALDAVNGMILDNTTTNKLQAYENGAWANII